MRRAIQGADPTLPALLRDARVFSERVAAESVPHVRHGPCRGPVAVAGFHEFHDRLGDDRYRRLGQLAARVSQTCHVALLGRVIQSMNGELKT